MIATAAIWCATAVSAVRSGKSLWKNARPTRPWHIVAPIPFTAGIVLMNEN